MKTKATIYKRGYAIDFHRTPTYHEGGVEFGRMTAMNQDVVAGWSTKRAAPGFMPDSVDKKGKVDQFSTNGSDHWYDIPNHKVRSINNEFLIEHFL